MQLLQYLGGREQAVERVFDSHGKYTQMAEEEGVEPSITASKAACVTVRISPYRTHARRFVHSTYTIYVEPVEGFKPPTCGLQDRCSIN